MNHNVISTAIASLLALGLASGSAMAAEKSMEKCFGVAKAGKNDCAGSKSSHSCAGSATKDGDRQDFVAVPKGTCDKIVNGSTDAMMDKGMMDKGKM